jgi:cobalt-zinc-cadmium efflux system membrane fusion protein
VAEKDLLQAQNDLATAKSGYEIAQAVREQTWRKLQLLELKPTEFRRAVLVRAPLTGQVLEVNVAPGEYRAAISFHTDTTAPLMTIADLSTVWVSSDVPEPFIPLIHIGEPVAITLVAFPDQTLTGRVARIGDVLDAQTRTLKVHVELPNPVGRFRPEMYGTIRHSGPSRPTLVVPAAALIQEYGRSVVFVERGPGRFDHGVDPDRSGYGEASDDARLRPEEPATEPVGQDSHADRRQQGGQYRRSDVDRTGEPGRERNEPDCQCRFDEMKRAVRESGE